ncbi:MAG: hypothetical protein ACO3EZ_19030, partial [Prochlorotrichaceae cyanobacterium]
TAMMNYDDRFDFPKFELPSWSCLEGGKGAKRGADGKFYLPAGSSPTAKMGVMGDDGDPNKPAVQPLGAKAKGEKVAGGKSIASVVDRNTDALGTRMSKSQIDNLKKLNEKSTREELNESLIALAGVDQTTFDPYINASRDTTGQLPPMWNEHFRRLQKIATMDDPDKVRSAVKDAISGARADARGLGANKEITAAMGRDAMPGSPLNKDPERYMKQQRQLYEKDFEPIANRMANIRIAQIKREQAAQQKEFAKERRREAQMAKSKKGTSPVEEITEEDLLSFF